MKSSEDKKRDTPVNTLNLLEEAQMKDLEALKTNILLETNQDTTQAIVMKITKAEDFKDVKEKTKAVDTKEEKEMKTEKEDTAPASVIIWMNAVDLAVQDVHP